MRYLRHGRLVLTFALVIAGGCSPWATYPPVETKAAQSLARPTFEPVPSVMAMAIEHTRAEYLPGKDLPINLPEGANWQVYDLVFGKLKGGGKPMMQIGEPAIHVKEVRTRAFDAQVDVVYPRGDGLNQLVTLIMQREVFKDWRITGTRPWQIRDIATPEPHYIPPTPAELVKKKKDVGPGGERVTLETRPATTQPQDWSALHLMTSATVDAFYRGRRVCVTGGAGFIGSHLVDALVARESIVSVIDDLSNASMENLRGVRERITFVLGSIRDPQALEAATAGADVIFHQAALGSVPRSIEQPERFIEVNVMGTLALLEAARKVREKAGVVSRVVYASSSSVYGDTPSLPKVETVPASPRSPYAASKYAGECLLQSHCACFGMSGVSLRYFNVFGPRQRHDSPYAAVVPRFIDALRTGRRPVIFGDGSQSRDFTHVENVVRANLLAGACEAELNGQALNIACGEQLNLLELLSNLRALMGATGSGGLDPEFAPPRPGDVQHSRADISHARELIGYAPSVRIREGLRHLIEAHPGGPARPA